MLTNSSADYVLENNLKGILSDMLQVLEQTIQTKEELELIQDHLQDYESLAQLVETMQFVFKAITRKLSGINCHQKFFKCEPKSQNYEKLEQVIQKYEQEIRIHIRTQHEMKIYIETILQELEESEQTRLAYLKESTQIIQKLKKENYQLSQQLKYYFKKQPTPLTSRRDSAQLVANQLQQKQPSRSAHNPNGLIMKQEETNKFQQPQTQQNSLTQLLKMTQKDSQKSLTQRLPISHSRNKSYSVGISKQSSTSFIQRQTIDKIQAIKKRSHHGDNKHRSSME